MIRSCLNVSSGIVDRLRPCARLLLALAFLLAVPGRAAHASAGDSAAGEFTPDVNTLLLAHFNDRLEGADYALGVSQFSGNGAKPCVGYFGGGIDLRPRGLQPDFATTCTDFTPRYDGWGFRGRGNVDPAQGTLECWFQPDDPQRPKTAWPGGVFLESYLQRAVPHPDKSKNMYASFSISLSTYSLKYALPTVAGNCFLGDVVFKTVPGYTRSLAATDWHHFALTWSQGEAVIWIDGRAAATFDMTGQLGLVLLENPVRYLSMSNCLLDELRISNIVRYGTAFEPHWRDGKRPEYAFSGVPDIRRFEPRLQPAPAVQCRPVVADAQTIEHRLGDYTLRLDAATGALAGIAVGASAAGSMAEGLTLHQGLQRRQLLPRRVRDVYRLDDTLRFTQEFDVDIEAAHKISPHGNSLVWQITLTNRGASEAWLEPLLGIECPLPRVTQWFDGCEAQRTLHLPRHRDEYCLTLPFVAASGNGRFVGLGTDPHTDLNDIVTQWAPVGSGGVMRQGTKLALSPGESFQIPFHIVHGVADFDTLDAIAAFHACFPDLYHLRPDVPVYSYMPATQELAVDNAPDLKRTGYAGGIWGHGPGHDKGDEFGRPEWWDNPELYGNREYQSYTRRIERIWQNLATLRECITYYYRQPYDNWYPVRRFHTCPDLTPAYIVASLWPGHEPNEDPLCFGQYYVPITNWKIVNEYNTPIGAFFQETTRQYFRQTQGYCVGYINDMSHAGALYRHNDPIAKQAPGRSFSRDLGTFVRKALGRKQRYEVLNNFVSDGHRASFWSDGGAFSYTLCAYSAAIAIEGAAMYKDLTGTAKYIIPARNLLGQKPLTAMTHMNDDWTGNYLRPDEFTPETLREYYRFCDSQLTLFGIQHGVTLDPTSYMFGRQISQERAALMVESTTLGRQIVPAARARPPLWVCRAGEGLQTLLIIGNSQPAAQTTDLDIVNRYFPAAPLMAPYYGGACTHEISAATTRLSGIQVEARDLQAFKALALLRSDAPAKVTSRLEGDGLGMRAQLDISAAPGALVWLSDFGPLYTIDQVQVDGRAVAYRPGEPLRLNAAQCQIAFTCRNRALAFTAQQWDAVELIKDGRTNFCLVADAGTTYTIPGSSPKLFEIGYERGTAGMLNDFVERYDAEDGVFGNLARVPLGPTKPNGFSGWVVRLSEDRAVTAGRVRIDTAAQEIVVEGPTQGEMRRAMVVLMRLVDRKYPHVGRFFPLWHGRLRYEPGKPVPLDKWVERKQTRDFYAAFSDPLFLVKPILRRQYESLYANDNMDFTGRYAMRYGAYIFEPTFADDYVYGYRGPGKATPREELYRMIRPAEKNRDESK